MNIIKNHNVKFNPNKKISCKTIISEAKKTLNETNQNMINSQDNNNIADELDKERKEILSNAKSEAAVIIEKAKEKTEEIEKKAFATGHDSGYVKGYEEGFEKGYSEKHQELEEKLAEINEKQKKYNQLYNQYLFHAEQDILKIIIEITKKLAKETYEENPDLLKELILDSIKSCAKKEKLVLRVNPENYDVIEAYKAEIIEKITGLEDIKVFKDESVSNYECFIETPYGNISTSLDDKIENIEKNLSEMIRSYDYQSGLDYHEK